VNEASMGFESAFKTSEFYQDETNLLYSTVENRQLLRPALKAEATVARDI